jgi:hypothetical protein
MYADYTFYENNYLHGRAAKIPEKEFVYWSEMASVEIQRMTFNRSDHAPESLSEVIGKCCCEVAEKLYSAESAKDKNGLILQSYSNDGESGTYVVDNLTESAVRKSVSSIIRKWLLTTGLIYRGVK